jgi:hypothetical protein
MNLILIGIILALLPVLNFFLTYWFSSKQGKLKFFKKHLTGFYNDWLFVPFNFLIVFTIAFSLKWSIALFLISLLLNLLIHKYYAKVIMKENNGSHFYDVALKKWTYSGFAHLVFSTIQTALILMFLAFSVKSYLTYIEGAVLIVFLSCMLVASKKTHNGKFLDSDLVSVIIGIVLTLAKMLYLLVL